MKSNKSVWITLGILAGISALAYLPLISKFGYFNDDWYLMYDIRTRGVQFFHDIFSSDRPGRVYLMIPLYSMFGLNPLYYNITAYLFRFLGGASLFWTLNMLWPQKRFSNVTAAILFTIYPGFLSQINAIDYQSHIAALFLAVLSVALTVKSVLAVERIPRLLLAAGSILCGWAYLSQMEYFIGMEAFRVACIVLLVWRSQASLREKMRNAALKWLPYITVPAGFLLWRVFYFQVERRATDIGFQIGQLFTSPLTGLWWLAYLIQDFLNVMLVVWAQPLYMFAFSMRLRDIWTGFALAGAAVLLFLLGSRWAGEIESETESGSSPRGMREELWVSLMSILGGLAPVIAANRHIILPDYSRYTMIASVGAVILLVALIERVSTRPLRMWIAGLLIAVGVMTHYGNSVRAVAETEAVRNFWWQVAWRAPGIRPGTTLSTSYPAASIQEDYFIWGPANHIYYPEKQDESSKELKLSAVVLSEDIIPQIIAGREGEVIYRRGDIVVNYDFSNVLVMAQAGENYCVRIIDGNSPELSVNDQERVMLIAPRSKLEKVLTEGESPIPPPLIFGSEPPHDWCFYYEKASLARQQDDWTRVAELGEAVRKAGLHPNDQIEWMPFLQAYAFLGDQKQVKDISTRINTKTFYAQQACHSLSAMAENGYPLAPEMQGYVDVLFCK